MLEFVREAVRDLVVRAICLPNEVANKALGPVHEPLFILSG
jgi:hypothetical protein